MRQGDVGAVAKLGRMGAAEVTFSGFFSYRALKVQCKGVERAVFAKSAETLYCRAVAYATCYIQSDADQSGLLMKVGSDDEAKIYLNEKEIYRCARARTYVQDQDVVTGVGLKAGFNLLVFKVVNESADWQRSVRLTDAAGQPIKGIGVTLICP